MSRDSYAINIIIKKERSEINKKVINNTKNWLSVVTSLYLIEIVLGMRFSRRHELFKDKKQRKNDEELKMSELYLISNPCFLKERDKEKIIKNLEKVILKPMMAKGDLEKDLKNQCFENMEYIELVLLPELAILQFRLQGLDIIKAENEFMTIGINDSQNI